MIFHSKKEHSVQKIFKNQDFVIETKISFKPKFDPKIQNFDPKILILVQKTKISTLKLRTRSQKPKFRFKRLYKYLVDYIIYDKDYKNSRHGLRKYRKEIIV